MSQTDNVSAAAQIRQQIGTNQRSSQLACVSCPLPSLNIFNMRSVMRNPPTTLVLEQATARKPRIVLSQPLSDPATTSEPISEMPEMALVADISGVCSKGGTRVM